MSKSNMFHQEFIERIKDEKVADAYFLATLEECKKLNPQEAQEHLIVALKNLSEAHGSTATFLKKIGVGYDAFYNLLSMAILKMSR